MSDWIGVEDRLPEEYDTVIVLDEDWCNRTCIATQIEGIFLQDTSVAESYGGEPLAALIDFKVTHWMPLPEPPSNKT